MRRFVIASLPVVAVALVAIFVFGSKDKQAKPAVVAQPASLPGSAHRTHHVHQSVLPPAPAQVTGAAARRMPIPILMYHVVATPTPTTPNRQLWVTPSTFSAEMEALKRAGYWAITTQDAWNAWTRGASLPRRPVVVSFDDGYLGDYTHARPVLQRLRWPGVLNLELHDVAPNNLPAGKVGALIRAGWEVNSHTVTHPDLTTVTPERLRFELVASRQQILRRFGVHARFFCYPAGRFNTTVQAAVRAAGYLAATTEIEGYATPADPYALPRVRVNGSDTPATLLARLAAERPRT